MNKNYEAFLLELGLPQVLADCMSGRITHPIVGFQKPFGAGAFPPALIPIWREGATYYGYWKHWFCDRPGTYVQVRMGSREAVEIARTAEQFLAIQIVSAICCHESIRPETRDFADRAGITNLDELNSLTLRTGDEPKGFAAVAQFQRSVPLNSVLDDNEYDGQFPTVADIRENIADSCSYEWRDEDRKSIAEIPSAPPWLLTSEQESLFELELRKNDLCAAWMTLNSSEWDVRAARHAIQELNSQASSEAFSLLACAWSQEMYSHAGTY